MNEDLTRFIIKQLGNYGDRKKVVQRVCKKSGLRWKDAERLVILVEAQHKRTITEYRSQSPVLLFVSITALLLGIGLLTYNLQILLAVSPGNIPEQIASLRGNSYRLIELGMGLGVTIGGMSGLWKALGIIFPNY